MFVKLRRLDLAVTQVHSNMDLALPLAITITIYIVYLSGLNNAQTIYLVYVQICIMFYFFLELFLSWIQIREIWAI